VCGGKVLSKPKLINILSNNSYSSEDMKPPNVTLDNMCIIDLERNREHAPQIRKLIQMHRDREINLQVVATSASEKKLDGTHPSHFDEFKHRIASTELGDVKILPTLCRSDFSFSDHCVCGGRWLDELEKEIQTILFTTDEVEYGDFSRKYSYDEKDKKGWIEWVNNKCDVLTLWSHIWYNGDIFVTDDNNFHEPTKKPRLIELGSGRILRPPEAVEMLDC
jgi:hypothetical protein